MTKAKPTIPAIGAAGKFASLVVPELANRGESSRADFRLNVLPI
jgi:hypothetical protein